jgi:hypothetical protein
VEGLTGSQKETVVTEALYESQVRKAERIGRLAADEGLDHDAVHEVALETERLAAIEAADVTRRARPLWLSVLLGSGAALAIGLFWNRIMDGTFELTLGSVLGAVGVLLIVVDLIWGSSSVRIGVALKQRWLYKTPVPVQLAVLQGYNERREELGQPGCDCLAALEANDGDAED